MESLAAWRLRLWSFIPIEGPLFGQYVPNILQAAIPVALFVSLLHALKNKTAPRFSVADLLAIGLGFWGLGGLYINDVMGRWKYYGNKVLYPIGFYYLVRLIPWDHHRVQQAVKVNLALVGTQSLLMIRQAVVGSSPLYGPSMHRAIGPFGIFWTSAAYLALWPSLFVYSASTSKSSLGRALSYLGLALNAYAITRTQQRAATFALIPVVLLCLVGPRMRPTATKVLIAGAIAFVPWSMSGAGSALMDRFNETDESRAAYRAAGWAIVRSSEWDPLFGVGFYHAQDKMRDIDVSELEDKRFLVFGTRIHTLSGTIKHGAPIHNFYLTILIEMGSMGALLCLSIFGLIVQRLGTLIGDRQTAAPVDTDLVISAAGSLLAWGGLAYIHNIYTMTAPMSVFWFWIGIIATGAPAFTRAEGASAATQKADSPTQKHKPYPPSKRRGGPAKG